MPRSGVPRASAKRGTSRAQSTHAGSSTWSRLRPPRRVGETTPLPHGGNPGAYHDRARGQGTAAVLARARPAPDPFRHRKRSAAAVAPRRDGVATGHVGGVCGLARQPWPGPDSDSASHRTRPGPARSVQAGDRVSRRAGPPRPVRAVLGVASATARRLRAPHPQCRTAPVDTGCHRLGLG